MEDLDKKLQESIKSHEIFTFIHNKVLTTQFYPEEFGIAHASFECVREMLKRLVADIAAIESQLKSLTKDEKAEKDMNEETKHERTD